MDFLNQIRIAMATAATQIQGEAKGARDDPQYDKRQQLSWQVINGLDGYLSRFAWAVAQNSAIALGSPVSIVSSTNANPVVVTTAAAHGYSTGNVVSITGHAVNTSANGAWTITVLTATTFSIPAVGAGVGTATGYVVKLPLDADIQFQVNASWDDIAGIRITD